MNSAFLVSLAPNRLRVGQRNLSKYLVFELSILSVIAKRVRFAPPRVCYSEGFWHRVVGKT
jgi:hypothetical protein